MRFMMHLVWQNKAREEVAKMNKKAISFLRAGWYCLLCFLNVYASKSIKDRSGEYTRIYRIGGKDDRIRTT